MKTNQNLNLITAEPLDGPSKQAKLRILIVDDSKLQRRILSASLLKLGYTIEEAANGREALDICQYWMPDLVLSDWMMPGMNGVDFCREFKNLTDHSYGYFILLTSKSAKDEVAHGLDAGADDFLTKPVNVHELRARLVAGERIIQMHRELISKNQVISSTLKELQEVHDSLNLDLIEAKKLQQSLVREKYKEFKNASLSFLLQSSGHVGGDLVGYFPISNNQVGVFSIDVSGHGISSALMTARLAGQLTSASPTHNIALMKDKNGRIHPRQPQSVMSELNALLLSEMETDHYFTMILACVDLETRRAVISQAGHPHPLVQRADGRIEQVGTGGLPIGLIEDAEYDQFEVQFEAGDRLLLTSDGITECPDCRHAHSENTPKFVGEEGFRAILHELSKAKGPELLERLVWQLADRAGHAGFPDDVSCALLEFA